MHLTPRELELAKYLKAYIAEHKEMPTRIEMQKALDVGHTRINRLIIDLRRKGCVKENKTIEITF